MSDLEAKKQVWTSPAVDPELRKAVLPLLEEALNSLQLTELANQQTAEFRAQLSELPGRVEKLKAAADAAVKLPDDTKAPPPGTSADALDVAASRLRATLENARQDAAAARDLATLNAARRKDLSSSVAELTARLLRLKSDTALPTAGEATELTDIRAIHRQAGLKARQAQIDAAQAELAWLDATDAATWSTLQLAAANRKLTAVEAAETALLARIERERTTKAAASLAEAERNQSEASPGLKPILQQVTLRAGENQRIVETLIPAAEAELRRTESETRHWLDLSIQTRIKIGRLGASGIVGVELRQQRQAMPSPATLSQSAGAREEALITTELARLNLEEELAGLPPPAPRGTPETDAAKAYRGSVETLLQSYAQYHSILIRLEEAAHQHAAVINSQRAFIHEVILWLPSTLPAGGESLSSVGIALKWLGSGLTDPNLPRSWWNGICRSPVTAGLIVMALGALFFGRRLGRRRLQSLARLAAQPDPGFRPTVAALAWTLVISLPWPLLLWAIALPWRHSLFSSPFSLTWSAALQQTALALVSIEFIRQQLRPHGVVLAHFQWPAPIVDLLRRQFRRLLVVFIPCLLLGLTFWNSNEVRHDAAERLCLITILLFSTWWLHQFWKCARAHTGLPKQGIARLLWQTTRLLTVLLPPALAILALRGYLYTAETLTSRLALTLFAASLFLLLRALFLRWHALHRRHLRSSRARKLRELREASRASTASDASPTASELPAETATEITGPNIDENGEEMRGLVDIIVFILLALTAWAIWADVFPAAKTLADRSVEGLSLSNGTFASPAAPAALPIPGLTAPTAAAPPEATTWLGILLSISIAGITFMAARRIPGAIQFLLSSQLALDPGARFALGTVTRYIIVITGVVLCLNMLGITWGSVQWLAAALTVGLGFGLQEIFANFFSGLIILLERPIRPGDIVTIDNITGTISRIEIRATTIRATDGKDYIVPNKEFVTGKLLNWTLSDSVTRQEIAIGVAYGTDPSVVLDLLSRIAREHPAVLKDPAPVTSFESFGESSLNFFLRFHVGAFEYRLSTLTDLNCAIAREFAAAGIAIPFPQRDLHVRSVPPGLFPPSAG